MDHLSANADARHDDAFGADDADNAVDAHNRVDAAEALDAFDALTSLRRFDRKFPVIQFATDAVRHRFFAPEEQDVYSFLT